MHFTWRLEPTLNELKEPFRSRMPAKLPKSLFLEAVPSLEQRFIDRYSRTRGDDPHSQSKNQTNPQNDRTRRKRETNRQYERAVSQIEAQREPAGCILEENGQLLVRSFIKRAGPEEFHDSIEDAVRSLIEKAKTARLTDSRRRLSGDWDALEAEGIRLWNEMRQPSPDE